MRCFIYQAGLLCETCGNLQAALLDQEGKPDTGDSDGYPQGPYCVGEADAPQHCEMCAVFLENPLTEEGRDYLAHVALGGRNPPMLGVWAAFYAPHTGIEGLAQWAARRRA
jgi:hypothetical protein